MRITFFKNYETGEVISVLDVVAQAKRGKKIVDKFCSVFHEDVSKKCVYMLTLTVHKAEDQEKALQDRSRFLNSYFQRIKRKGYKIRGVLCVTEPQKRGVIHFHIVFVTDKPLYFNKVPDWLKPDIECGRYKRLWKWGCTNIVRIDKSLRRYLAKYFCNSKKITKRGFMYLYDLRKLVGKNKKLVYSFINKQARNLAYKILSLPTSVYLQIKDMVKDIIDVKPAVDGFLIKFKFSGEYIFVPKPKFIFLGWKEIEFEGA